MPQERRRHARRASRPARPATSSGGARTTPSATSRPTTSRRAPSTTPPTRHADGRGAVARRGDAGLCLTCGAADRAARGRPRRACASQGGPPDPAALAAAGARRRAPWRRGVAQRDGGSAVDASVGRIGASRDRVAARAAVSGARVARRARGGPPDVVTGPEALRRFLRSLEARDASPRDAPLVRDDRRRLPRLARGARRRLAVARAGRPCAPTSRTCPRATRRRRSPSGWPRSARSTATRARSGLAPGDPWGAIATPRLPRRLPKVLEVEQVEALLAVIDDDLDAPARRRATVRDRAPGPGARARDRAARPGARRDRVRRRPADQRARRRRPRQPRPAARRAAGAGQGAQGARSGCWAGRPARRSRPTSPTAARRSSRAATRCDEPPTAVFLNHHGGPLGVRGLRGAPRPPAPARGPARGRQPAHAAPHVRDPPARGRRGPAGRAGAAGPREPRHDADLHARVAGAPPRGLPARRTPGRGPRDGRPDDVHRRASSRPRGVPAPAPDDDGGRASGRADATLALARAGLIVTVAVPAVAGPGLRPDVAIAAAVPDVGDLGAVLRGVPDPRLPVPARRRRRAVVDADPGHRRACSPRTRRRGPGGSCRRSPR